MCPVVLLGETGTGKTLLAHAIHNSSARAEKAFLSFNASAMSDTLLESQLFGHERGAFTGAQQTVKGKFELAHGGTLFLDEISEMSPLAQVKILRALEYGEFERPRFRAHADRAMCRVICAGELLARESIRKGKFREDLYHRLNGLTLLIPPLRERLEELPALIATELKNAAAGAGKNIEAIHPEAMRKLVTHEWRGNLARAQPYGPDHGVVLRRRGNPAGACRLRARSRPRADRRIGSDEDDRGTGDSW
jgi:transcriptional regulator with PAS, ATPase and Fis domain